MDAENRAVVRRIVPNMGMVEEVKTLATAGTVPGRDRTVEEFDMLKHTPRPTANRTIVRKLAGAWFTTCPCGYLWRSTHHRLALLFAVEHKCGRRA